MNKDIAKLINKNKNNYKFCNQKNKWLTRFISK